MSPGRLVRVSLQQALLILVILAPLAAAQPIAGVGVGPDGVVTDAHKPYYVFVNATMPEAPHGGPAYPNDCATPPPPDPRGNETQRPRPQTLDEGARRVLDPVVTNPPTGVPGSVSPYVPRCIAVPLKVCILPTTCVPTGYYVSYNVAEGRYYIEPSFFGVPLPGPATRATGYGTTGTDGAQITTDCFNCPPPLG